MKRKDVKVKVVVHRPGHKYSVEDGIAKNVPFDDEDRPIFLGALLEVSGKIFTIAYEPWNGRIHVEEKVKDKEMTFWKWLYINLINFPTKFSQVLENISKELKKDPFYEGVIGAWGTFLAVTLLLLGRDLFEKFGALIWAVFLFLIFLHAIYRTKMKKWRQ